jgi:hypothetical protein
MIMILKSALAGGLGAYHHFEKAPVEVGLYFAPTMFIVPESKFGGKLAALCALLLLSNALRSRRYLTNTSLIPTVPINGFLLTVICILEILRLINCSLQRSP